MTEIAFFSKWLHLLSIIGILGGLVFAWMVLAPPTNAGSEAPAAPELWQRLRSRMHILWAVAFVTGLYNLSVVSPTVNPQYQMQAGIKIMLAILMMILATIVVRKAAAPQSAGGSKSQGLLFAIFIGIVIVGISAHLNMSRVNGTGLKSEAIAR